MSSLMFAMQMRIPIGFIDGEDEECSGVAGAPNEARKAVGLLLLVAVYRWRVSPVFVIEQYLGPLAFLLLLFSAPWNAASQVKQARLYVFLGGAMLGVQ